MTLWKDIRTFEAYDEKYIAPQCVVMAICFVVIEFFKDYRMFAMSIVAGIVAYNLATALCIHLRDRKLQEVTK